MNYTRLTPEDQRLFDEAMAKEVVEVVAAYSYEMTFNLETCGTTRTTSTWTTYNTDKGRTT